MDTFATSPMLSPPIRLCVRSDTICFVVAGLMYVALIWLPFGFSLGGMIEEWDLMFHLTTHPGQWNSFPGGLIPAQFAARPLQITVFWLAQKISSNSFLGFHLLLMLGCFIRVYAGAVIGRYIFGRGIYAVALGIFALVFPADTQQLSFRTINISSSLALSMAGAASALTAIESKMPLHRWALILSSMLLYAVAALVYEPSITLYSIVPLAILAKNGFQQSVKLVAGRRREALLWLLAPIFSLCYFLYAVLIFGSSYQDEKIHGGYPTVLSNLHYFWSSLAFRLFLDAWTSAADIIFNEVQRWSYISLAGAIILAGFLLLSQRQAVTRISETVRIVFCGAMIAILAYLPFMIAESHLTITQRTMMAASLGGAIVAIAILRQAFSRHKYAAAATVALLVFVGFVSQLYQMDTYTRTYVTIIRPYMAMIVDRSDHSKRTHLVTDESGIAGYLNGMFISKIMYGPPVRQNRYDESYQPCMINRARSPYILTNQCRLEESKWLVTDHSGNSYSLAAQDVDVINIERSFDDGYSAKAAAWHDLGSYEPASSIFRFRSKSANWYACQPDSMWGYSNFCRGIGWTDGLYKKMNWSHFSYIAAVDPDARLIFEMKPSATIYRLTIQTLNGAAFPALSVDLNSHRLAFFSQSNDLLEAEVRPDWLIDGANVIGFHNALRENQNLGLLVKKVTLTPNQTPLVD